MHAGVAAHKCNQAGSALVTFPSQAPQRCPQVGSYGRWDTQQACLQRLLGQRNRCRVLQKLLHPGGNRAPYLQGEPLGRRQAEQLAQRLRQAAGGAEEVAEAGAQEPVYEGLQAADEHDKAMVHTPRQARGRHAVAFVGVSEPKERRSCPKGWVRSAVLEGRSVVQQLA